MRAPPTRASSRSTSPAQRVQAALLVCVFLVGNLAALIHAATTTHRRCPEHGELIDDEDAPAADAPSRPLLAARPDPDQPAADALRSAPAEESAGHHGHCFLGCVSHQQSAPGVGPCLAPAPARFLEPSSPAPAPLLARGPELYRTAPKTSPPVA